MFFTINNFICVHFDNICLSNYGKSLKSFFKNQWSKLRNKNFAHTTCGLRGSYHLNPRLFQKKLNEYWFFWISHFFHYWKITHRSLKKVCDEVSKIKNVYWLFFSIFRPGRHGRSVFFPTQLYMGIVLVVKSPILFFGKMEDLSKFFLD